MAKVTEGMDKADEMEDIGSVSNTTVAILLILTLLVSVIGTWSVLRDTDSAQSDGGAEGIQGGAPALIDARPSPDSIGNPKETGRAAIDVPEESDE